MTLSRRPRQESELSRLLSVRRLSVSYPSAVGPRSIVEGLDIDVVAGECVALIGESGCGKSQSMLALLGLSPRLAQVRGQAMFQGEDLLTATEGRLNAIRGRRIGVVFQDPLTALAPHLSVGEQIAEGLRRHHALSRSAARHAAVEWLARVRIAEPELRARQFPHQLSGGMRQRVMIAQALACEPDLVIADEPTTALDVTVQAEILDLLDALRQETGVGLILITHDMGVVGRMAQRVHVMQRGKCIESGDVGQVLTAPRSDHAQALLAAVPRLAGAGRPGRNAPRPVAADAAIVLQASDIRVRYRLAGGVLRPARMLDAVDGIGFEVRAGETVGLVGESGSGKSTLARAALRLAPAQGGAVTLLGEPLSPDDQRALRRARRDLQIVFQDPLGSLNPRQTIGVTVAEPLRVHRPDLGASARRATVSQWLQAVGLPAAFADRYPHQLSGGQAQRVGIARAMVLGPKLVVCDEAVSALDVSVRAQIVDLLVSLQQQTGMGMLFISHDLAVVREVAHRVLVMHRGQVVETGPTEQVLSQPVHPYTRALIASALDPQVPSLAAKVQLSSARG